LIWFDMKSRVGSGDSGGVFVREPGDDATSGCIGLGGVHSTAASCPVRVFVGVRVRSSAGGGGSALGFGIL
jgi:hypothetical protein